MNKCKHNRQQGDCSCCHYEHQNSQIAKINKLEARNVELEKRNKELEAELNKYKSETINLDSELASAELENSELQAWGDRNLGQVTALKKGNATLEKENKKSLTLLEEARQSINSAYLLSVENKSIAGMMSFSAHHKCLNDEIVKMGGESVILVLFNKEQKNDDYPEEENQGMLDDGIRR